MSFKFKLLVLSCILLSSSQSIFSQNTNLVTNLNEINNVTSFLSKDAFEKHISILSDDEMKGRNMIEGGDRLAAKYIKSIYELNRLPTYMGERALTFSVFIPQYTKFKMYNENAILSKDHFNLLPFNTIDLNGELEILYVDKINYKNLYRRYTRDKGVIFHQYDHFDETNDLKIEDLDAKLLISVRDNEFNLSNNDFRSIDKIIPIRYLDKEKFFKHNEKDKDEANYEWLYMSWSSVLSLFSEEQQAMISKYNMLKKKDQRKLKTKVNIEMKNELLEYKNEHILAYVEGSDLKDEIVLVHANYDGNGVQRGVVYNGANGNATGTAAVMELAVSFQKAKEAGYKPRRSILFVNFTANEPIIKTGEYFFCEYSGLPINNIVANFKLERLGRKSSSLEDKNYCYLLGTDLHSSTYKNVIKQIGNAYEKDLNILDTLNKYDYLYSLDGPLTYRGIPTTILTDNCNEDLFNPSDDIEKIDFDLVYKRTKLSMKLIWEIANRSDIMEKDLFIPNKYYPRYY